jgi:G:T/U-mismatch repair DNA glycosylase
MAAQAAIHANFRNLFWRLQAARCSDSRQLHPIVFETCVDGRRHGGAVLRTDAAMTIKAAGALRRIIPAYSGKNSLREWLSTDSVPEAMSK